MFLDKKKKSLKSVKIFLEVQVDDSETNQLHRAVVVCGSKMVQQFCDTFNNSILACHG